LANPHRHEGREEGGEGGKKTSFLGGEKQGGGPGSDFAKKGGGFCIIQTVAGHLTARG